MSRTSPIGPFRNLNRFLELLVVVSFILPFATVEDRSSSLAGTYTGIDLIRGDFGVLLVCVPASALLLFLLSFRPRTSAAHRVGSTQALKAFICAVAGITAATLTEMTFLFWDIIWRAGMYLCTGSWIVLYLLSISAAGRCVLAARRADAGKPPPWGAVAGLVAVAVAVVTIAVSSPSDLAELVIGCAAWAVVALPLVLLVQSAATRRWLRSNRSGEVPQPPEVRVEE